MIGRRRGRDERGRPPEPRRVKDMVQSFAGNVAPETPEADVQAAWLEAVGRGVAEVTRVSGEHDGTVVIECESAVWAEELGLMEPRMRASLNRVLVDRGGDPVEKLSFRAGDL